MSLNCSRMHNCCQLFITDITNRCTVVISVIYLNFLFCKNLFCCCCHQALLRMDKHIPKQERFTRVEKSIAEVQDMNLCVILWKSEGKLYSYSFIHPSMQLINHGMHQPINQLVLYKQTTNQQTSQLTNIQTNKQTNKQVNN